MRTYVPLIWQRNPAFTSTPSRAAAVVRSTDHNLLNLFELYRASRWQTLIYLRLPNALPYFLAGLRIAGGLAPLGLAAVVACIVHFVPDGRWYVDARPGIALKALTWDTVYLLVVGAIAAPLSYLLLRIAERRRAPRRGRWVAATIGVLAGGLLGLYVATIGALVMAGPH